MCILRGNLMVVWRVAASPLSLQQLSSVPKLGYHSHQDNRLTRPPRLLRKEFENAVESLQDLTPSFHGSSPWRSFSRCRRPCLSFQVGLSAPPQWPFWAALTLLLLHMDSQKPARCGWAPTETVISMFWLWLFAELILPPRPPPPPSEVASGRQGTTGHRILRSTASDQESIDGLRQCSGRLQESSCWLPKHQSGSVRPGDEAVTQLVVDFLAGLKEIIVNSLLRRREKNQKLGIK